MNSPRRDRTRGATMVELVVYIAILAVMVNLAVGTFASAMRLNTRGMETLETARALGVVQEDFRRTVREAVALPDAAGIWTSDGDTLVIELAPEGGNRRYAVFGVLDDPAQISRHLFSVRPDGSVEPLAMRTYNLNVGSVAFDRVRVPGCAAMTLRTARGREPRVLLATPRGKLP
jgi:type II secretory pathway pseudopilin PulG